MRYFSKLRYKGTNYNGWQRQPNSPTVQQTIEEALATILRKEIGIMGCGRTDTGVHAKEYFIHFDFEEDFPAHFVDRLNKVLPKDIAIENIFEVASEAHTRFDANSRSYEYHIVFHKNPFFLDTTYYFPFYDQLDFNLLQAAAKLLMEYEAFYPFCKSNTDVKTMRCDITHAEWKLDKDEKGMVFYISANRFLRGMVRLIVGMCLNVALGKISLEEVEDALKKQERLRKSYSVPPQGLFLTDIRYPFL